MVLSVGLGGCSPDSLSEVHLRFESRYRVLSSACWDGMYNIDSTTSIKKSLVVNLLAKNFVFSRTISFIVCAASPSSAASAWGIYLVNYRRADLYMPIGLPTLLKSSNTTVSRKQKSQS